MLRDIEDMLVRLNGRAVSSVLVDARVTRLSAVVVAPTNGAPVRLKLRISILLRCSESAFLIGGCLAAEITRPTRPMRISHKALRPRNAVLIANSAPQLVGCHLRGVVGSAVLGHTAGEPQVGHRLNAPEAVDRTSDPDR